MIYINDTIADITEKELEDAIKELPEWRKAQTMRFKHLQGRKECTFSYLLLCKALKDMDISVQPTFIYGENGKPTLKEYPDVHFNMSHCKAAVVCAVSGKPVGIDIEVFGRYSERLACYTMNEEELREIDKAANRDIAFTRLWTMKEATMKLTGEGISTNVRDVLTHSYNIIIYKTTVNVERGYVVTTAEWK